jgi:hypothetical protein
MASNMSQSEEVEDEVDNDLHLGPLNYEEMIIPQPHYYSIWDCPHINKVVLEENRVVKNGWRF